MTATAYEVYTCPCPRCGYPEAIDRGPYDPHWLDAALGTPDPRIHLMWCGRCGKPFDAGPADVPCPVCQAPSNACTAARCGADGCTCDAR